MTTTPETSLEVNAGPHHARRAFAKPRFHSLALSAPSVRPNQGKTHAIYTWLSRAHFVLPRAAKQLPAKKVAWLRGGAVAAEKARCKTMACPGVVMGEQEAHAWKLSYLDEGKKKNHI